MAYRSNIKVDSKVEEVIIKVYTDQYFFDNGYWFRGDENTIGETEKWRMLFDTCINVRGNNNIILPETLHNVIEGGSTKRNAKYIKKKDRTENKAYINTAGIVKYVKKERPEGYLTVKERKAITQKLKEEREERINKHVNRTT